MTILLLAWLMRIYKRNEHEASCAARTIDIDARNAIRLYEDNGNGA